MQSIMISGERLSSFECHGKSVRLPLFMPVYQPRSPTFRLALWQSDPPIDACIVNAFFLYKQREIREALLESGSLHDYIGFKGLVTTDSGAFQGFTRPLFLKNRDIVRFQDRIGSDVLAPLDLVTPPGNKRTEATKKLKSTQKRIREALELAEYSIVAGVQQGGRFLDLRQQSVDELAEMGVRYLSIGSLVPFFNKNHEMRFVASVLTAARKTIGNTVPIHIYGAGDPCELPFLYKLGADIFDSSSYAHYAKGGWYMTPYGALKDAGPLQAGEYRCECPICNEAETIGEVFGDEEKLTRHNLWTICATVEALRSLESEDALDAMLARIIEVHDVWFPTSALSTTWNASQSVAD
jgi:7-cyano-7-deazaguanine tRNA-ribosyltransferase